MAYKVETTTVADQTYLQIVQFLISNYGGQTAQKFEDATKKCVELLQVNPSLFEFNDEFQCRKAIIDRYTSMFYEVKNLVIIVHLFWHNRKNPSNISIQL
ncbi:MAG: type II toxin-antitoxin system RelE/ParE family toxin [Flavobacteriaceae bacterium]